MTTTHTYFTATFTNGMTFGLESYASALVVAEMFNTTVESFATVSTFAVDITVIDPAIDPDSLDAARAITAIRATE
jgi:hypothetical protein